MNWFSGMKVRNKIILCFTISFLMIASLGALSFRAGSEIESNVTRVLTEIGSAAQTIEYVDHEVRSALDSISSSAESLVKGAFIICTLSLAGALGIGWLLVTSITRPLTSTVNMIHDIGNGVLNKRLNMKRKDEIGQMANSLDAFAENLQNEIIIAFEKLAEGDFTFEAKGLIKKPLSEANIRLNQIMSQMQAAGNEIASGSGKVAQSSKSLSHGATEQASSVLEISSSMNEMASQTKTNAENANQANQLTLQASEAANKGNNQMQDMIAAMAEINESSQNISKIINVIDEIAFQTNLLALNAAVEAARAGKHGKGFAVVAEEVRNLAARSAKAAQETANLIEGSTEKTERGAEIANKTAEALVEIVGIVSKVSDLGAEIASASNDQAQDISQVNQGLTQIDQVTQQNSANAEQSAEAAHELSSQAVHLREMLDCFTLKS